MQAKKAVKKKRYVILIICEIIYALFFLFAALFNPWFLCGIIFVVLIEKYRRNRVSYENSESGRMDAEREAVRKDCQRRQKELSVQIVSANIIGTDSKSKTSSAIGRAIVGDFMAGGVGSIVGASTAKKDGMTKFLVEFADGHKSVETVKDNSLRFQELIKYVQM